MTDTRPTADTDDAPGVRAWLAAWGAEVAARQFDTAAHRFHADVVGFGTRATVARGLPALMADQWRHVWPAIDDFAFDADGADVWVSPDRLQAVVAGAWSSQGRTAEGATFPRGGRATVVVARASLADPWLGVHTHFSLEPVDPGTHTGS
ncbi:MAG TPA: hypothetical protein VK866_10285 [Acidimicrobiales bacterium]|nr:hypothetical protein [Acidimicrobiales bacterium]